MTAKVEIISLIGKQRIDYTMIVGERLDNEVSPLIPRGVRVDGQKPNLKIEIDDFERDFPDGFRIEKNDKFWGNLQGDGSPRKVFCIYPGTVLKLTPSKDVLMRFSSTDQKNIDRNEITQLGRNYKG